jgi:ribosomal protein S18 acetylase RimI-like enzyme
VSAPIYRAATRADGLDLAAISDISTFGLSTYAWILTKHPTASPMAAGREQARQETGSFSYRNAMIAEIGGEVAGGIVGHFLDESYADVDPRPFRPFMRPLIELRSKEVGSWYISTLAVFPDYRGRRLGEELIRRSEDIARARALARCSLLVRSGNTRAVGLYEQLGYAEKDNRPFISIADKETDERWILMAKDIGAPAGAS